MGGGSDSVDVCGGTIGFERRGDGPPLWTRGGWARSDGRSPKSAGRGAFRPLSGSPVSVGEELHAQIPGSTFVVIPGPGHMVNLEAPDRFNHEVRSFLTRSAS
jgi:pimeloyl-ACP methyl ester carboxylesterase